MIKAIIIYQLIMWTIIIIELINAPTDVELWGKEVD